MALLEPEIYRDETKQQSKENSEFIRIIYEELL